MAQGDWRAELAAALGAQVNGAQAIRGGDICEAYRVELADGRQVFVKRHAAPAPGMFAAEAAGLAWLAAGPLRVPGVHAVGEGWLALEWLALGSRPTGAAFAAALGRGLAGLHRIGAPSFGFTTDNYLATLPQANAPLGDWPSFYLERRLRPLVERAMASGAIGDVRRQMAMLAARPERFGPDEAPARLHGDLWWGNVGSVAGAPVIFDPAVYGGHREVDLAMLALFGELPDALVAAYEEVWPLADGWRDRLRLHQLVPLAAHAVLFGRGYGAQLEHALATVTR
jgi:fructosamine-3-kinase